jgi:transcriptional regulator with XRE-family HTH domain
MIGEALRLLRTLHDKKLTDLADELSVSAGYLSEIEHSKRKPNLEIIEKYAEYFEVKKSAILLFSEEIDESSTKGKVKSFARSKMIRLMQIIEQSGSSSERQT